RRKEFAGLRTSGATRVFAGKVLLTESVLLSSAGALCGILAGLLILLPFAGMIKESLTRPYLLPDVSTIFFLSIGAFCVTTVSGALSAVWAIRGITASDMGKLLREDT
ncbi:MAG: FtsX-like permease family protein, partial [Oscillospiraceae bacterium]|nr:FtsX-like permease family protein [Oscillospiraceae bacterium]